MSGARVFFDTNVLLYLLSSDAAKADRAEALLGQGGTVSVQVLNEFAAVALRKLRLSHAEVREVLEPIRVVCKIEVLAEETHDLALQIAECNAFNFYDALIVAAALLAGCDILYSEDLQDGQVVDGRLTVRNPFGDKAAR